MKNEYAVLVELYRRQRKYSGQESLHFFLNNQPDALIIPKFILL